MEEVTRRRSGSDDAPRFMHLPWWWLHVSPPVGAFRNCPGLASDCLWGRTLRLTAATVLRADATVFLRRGNSPPILFYEPFPVPVHD